MNLNPKVMKTFQSSLKNNPQSGTPVKAPKIDAMEYVVTVMIVLALLSIFLITIRLLKRQRQQRLQEQARMANIDEQTVLDLISDPRLFEKAVDRGRITVGEVVKQRPTEVAAISTMIGLELQQNELTDRQKKLNPINLKDLILHNSSSDEESSQNNIDEISYGVPFKVETTDKPKSDSRYGTGVHGSPINRSSQLSQSPINKYVKIMTKSPPVNNNTKVAVRV